MNDSKKLLIVILICAVFLLGLVLLVNKTIADMPRAPETFAPETYVTLAPGEGGITPAARRAEADYASDPAVTAWLAQCRSEARDDVGVYALCFRSTADGQTTLHYLILRTGLTTGADVSTDLKQGSTFCTASVVFTPSGEAPADGCGLWELTATIPEDGRPELDVVLRSGASEDDHAGVVVTYADKDFRFAQ